MEFCEDIVREEILIEFDDGTKPKKDLKEKSRKKRYFKIETFFGEKKTEKIGFIINTIKIKYQRKDETDESGENIIKKGIEEKEIGKQIIATEEERHLIGSNNETLFKIDEYYEYRNQQRVKERIVSKIFRYGGIGLTAIRGDFI